MDALGAAEPVDYLRLILGELRDVNANLTALAIAISRTPGRQSAAVRPGIANSGGELTTERRTAMALEQLGRPSRRQQVAEVRVAGAPEPGVKPAAPAWGLDLGSPSLVLDVADIASGFAPSGGAES